MSHTIVKCAAVSFLGLASVARADVIVEQASYAGCLDSSTGGGGILAQPCNPDQPPGFFLPQFNVALGSLQSASLEISGAWHSEAIIVGVVGSSESTIQGILNSSLFFSVFGGAQPELLYHNTPLPQDVTLTNSSGALFWTGYGPLLAVDMTFPIDLATATSGVPFNQNDEIFVSTSGGANIPHDIQDFAVEGDESDLTYGNFTGTMTYTYAPIPEPSTVALLILPIMMLSRRLFGSMRF